MTSTLTLINALPLVTSINSTLTQLIVNETSANNTLSRITVGNFLAEFLPEGALISNVGGTAAALDISPLFAISSVGTDGLGTLGLGELAAGQLLGNPTSATGSVVGKGLSEFFDSNFGSIEGQILYRGANSWLALAPGTAGDVLTTQDEAGPPIWASVGVPIVDVVGGTDIGVVTTSGTATVSFTGTTGSSLEIAEGTTSVTGVSLLTLEGFATLSGASGHATLSVGGGGGSLEVVGGTTTVSSVSEIVFEGGSTVSGSAGTATVSVGGGSSSLELTDGSHTVTGVTEIILSTGGSLAGSGTGTATLDFAAGGGIELIQGTTTLSGIETLTITGSGGTLTGASASATLNISGGGGGGGSAPIFGDPVYGMSMVGRTYLNRPALSALTAINTPTANSTITEYNNMSGEPIGPLVRFGFAGGDGTVRGWGSALGYTSTQPFYAYMQFNLAVIDNGASPQAFAGLTFWHSSTGAGLLLGVVQDNGQSKLIVIEVNAGGGAGATQYSQAMPIAGSNNVWIKFYFDGADDYRMDFSLDGVGYYQNAYSSSGFTAACGGTFPDMFGPGHDEGLYSANSADFWQWWAQFP